MDGVQLRMHHPVKATRPQSPLPVAHYMTVNVIPTSPTEMSIYHRSGDRYVLRTDGFVSAHAGSKPGELLTYPFVFSGNSLDVNVSTSAAGSLRVELQQPDGTPIPHLTLADCPPIYADEIERSVHWRGDPDLSTVSGQPIRLRFVLTESDLYSFRFRKSSMLT